MNKKEKSRNEREGKKRNTEIGDEMKRKRKREIRKQQRIKRRKSMRNIGKNY